MVFTVNVSTIVGTTTINEDSSQYIINVSAGATVTLPTVVSDGQNFNFIRVDTAPVTVSIVPPDASQFIYGNGTPLSVFQIASNTSVSFVSLSGNWYMTQNSSTSGMGIRPYFSTAYRSTGTNGFIQINGVTPFSTNSLSISTFYFEGTNQATINIIKCVISVNATGRSYRVFLANLSGTVYATTTGTVPVANTPTLITFSITSPLPQTGTLLELRANVDSGSTGSMRFYSAQMY